MLLAEIVLHIVFQLVFSTTNICCPQGHLEKLNPAVKEVRVTEGATQQLNPTSKMLCEQRHLLNIEYGVKFWG